MHRCSWAESNPLLLDYHDQEWGVPVHDDRKLFEFLVLEGMQAGLSWLTILRKRDSFREAFDHFNPEIVACYDQQKRTGLLNNRGIIRNRLKINSAIANARAFLALREKDITFNEFVWQLTEGKTIDEHRKATASIPAHTELSGKLSKELKKAGFSFVGPVVCYSFMQAVGMVNDHVVECFRHDEIAEGNKRWYK